MPSKENLSKILFVIAHEGFRDEELATPRKILEGKGFACVVASTDTTVAKGMLGAKVKPDLSLRDVKSSDYRVLVLVGGAGAKKLWDDTTLIRIVREFNDAEKVIGAICLAPVVLSRAGILKDLEATCFASVSGELEAGGARYVSRDVVTSGRIVTASGPEAARAFGETIAKLLTEGGE